MKQLPDDFNMNMLLPGAVWLLISFLIGGSAVARMETDAIAVILFVVISIVAFVIPMAIYMEYRKRIGQWAERKSPRASSDLPSDLPSDRSSSVAPQPTVEPDKEDRPSFPADFPNALKGSKAMAFMEALRQEGFLDAEYRPQEGCNATLMAVVADSIASLCHIQRQWKVFGDYWQLNNMRQLLAVKNRRGSKADKEELVIAIITRVAEADETIRETNAYRSWVKNNQI